MAKNGRAGATRTRGRASAVLLAGLSLLIAPFPLVKAQTIPNEYRLKAAFVYQFPQFVEWPSASWRDAAALQLCVLQPNPFGRELEALVRGESLKGLPFSIKEISGPEALAGCHVLFVGAGAPGGDAVLKHARSSPILTVGEGDRFLDAGGIIALRVVERRVRFDVSASAAQKVGLRISSQLLSLALNVRGGPS